MLTLFVLRVILRGHRLGSNLTIDFNLPYRPATLLYAFSQLCANITNMTVVECRWVQTRVSLKSNGAAQGYRYTKSKRPHTSGNDCFYDSHNAQGKGKKQAGKSVRGRERERQNGSTFALSSFFDVSLPRISPLVCARGWRRGRTHDIPMYERIFGMCLCKQHIHVLSHYTTIAIFTLQRVSSVPNARGQPSNLALFQQLPCAIMRTRSAV